MTTLAERLAGRIHALRFEDIPPPARAWAASAFADTVGVGLAGIVEEGPRILLGVPGVTAAAGPSLVLGTRRRTAATDAALVNGTAAHAHDYDDVAGVLGGHPSAMLVPALLPLAEGLGRSGRDLVLAYVAGFEAMCRIARGVHHHHYEKGWHPTSTLGIFGTVAAASRLLRLDVPRTAVALGLAASFSAGLKANFGTMAKPLHVGHAVRDGLFAALLAERGFTANPAAFEHPQGFLDVFNGPGTYDAARMLDGWYEPFECAGAAGPFLKPYPCCGSTHAPVGRMIALSRQHGLTPEQVERVLVMPHPRRLPHTDNPDPRTPLAAKFSVQYCVARALADRRVTLGDFEGDAPFEPRIRALMRRIEARPHPDMPDEWGTEVIVETTNGRRLASRLDNNVSRSPAGEAMTHAELWTKFADCASRSLRPDRLQAAFETLMRMEALSDVRELTALLEGDGA